ncbi:hypothetical protein GH714_032987 [Hevea brasiliensis]|uniref:Myb-like domain-containing protein n=1 Tax=Hevea brasiliensis TaxID=3981 RepID=A0A6A6L4U8_HEVBR|nr:hypothetical protein GH714_032987 [Hevea brasiliensis]
MGRQPCCDKVGLKKGPWTAEEDKKLINFILNNGQCCWRAVPKLADFEWPDNDIDWWVDDLSSCLDLLINDVDSDRKQVDALDDHYPHPPINQYPEMVLDQDSWTYGIL